MENSVTYLYDLLVFILIVCSDCIYVSTLCVFLNYHNFMVNFSLISSYLLIIDTTLILLQRAFFLELNLRAYTCCHSLYEIYCASVLLCLEDTITLKSFTTSGCTVFLLSLPLTSLSHGGVVWWSHPIYDWVFHSLLLSVHCPVAVPCISYCHKLQQESCQMEVQPRTDLWVCL